MVVLQLNGIGFFLLQEQVLLEDRSIESSNMETGVTAKSSLGELPF
jgi:hypothetical protein